MKRRIRTYSNDEELVAERRKQIVKVATKLYVKNGYEHTNTRELCDALGMSKGTLYHYVGTKTDTLYLVFQFALEDQEKLIDLLERETKDSSTIEAIKISIHQYFSNVDELQDMYNFINHTITDLPKADRHIIFDSEENMVMYFERLIKKGVKRGEIIAEEPTLLAHNIVITANAWAHRRWFLRKHVTIQEYIRRETDRILKTIRSEV